MIYYNEWDKDAAQWLRELIKAKLIPDGDVDESSITNVKPEWIKHYTQCHFFAGIGGWAYALQLANWPINKPVWTGSCPCQPFSSAGKQEGTSDIRHLWPEFHRLIAQCNPPTIFGEQVAGSAGREWLSGIRVDLEALEYAVGSADLCAAGEKAPHIRQRLYWMGKSNGARWIKRQQTIAYTRYRNTTQPAGYWSNFDIVQCTDKKLRRIEPGTFPLAHGVPTRVGRLRGYGNAIVPQVAARFIQACAECGI